MNACRFDLRPLGNPRYQEVVHRPLLSAEECDRIVARLDPDGWNAAGVSQEGTDTPLYDARVRSADLQNLPLDGSWPLDRLVAALGEVNEEIYRFQLTGLYESDRPSVARYRGEETNHFRSHQDAGPHNPCRKLTYIVQLSRGDDYQGGDLLVNDVARLAPRDQGTLVVFPSSMYHVVAPVTMGERLVIIGWVHGPTAT